MLKLVITPQSIIHKGYSVSSKDVFFFIYIFNLFISNRWNSSVFHDKKKGSVIFLFISKI